MTRPNLKSVALPVPEIIAIDVLGGGLRTPILGSRMVLFERALVSSYRPSIVTFQLFLYLYAFQRYVLQHSTVSHPITSLPKISACSPGSRRMAFGLRRAKVLG